jgi:hypothetical protein
MGDFGAVAAARPHPNDLRADRGATMRDTSRSNGEAAPPRLVDAPERAVGLRIVDPLDQRLDALVEQAAEVGMRTNRKELIAALILQAPEDPYHLTRLVAALRRAPVGDYLIPGGELVMDGGRTPRPGPRPVRVREQWRPPPRGGTE